MFWKRKKEAAVKSEPKIETQAKQDLAAEDLYPGYSDNEIQEYIDQNAIQRKAPLPKAAEGVAMDSCSSATVMPSAVGGSISPRTLAYYVASSSFIGYQAMAIIGQHWLVRKGLEKRPRDAARKWYRLAANDGEGLTADVLARIKAKDAAFNLKNQVIEAVTFNRMFGIRHVIFKHKDPNFDYSKPFNPDSFGIGDYAGIVQVDPMYVVPELSNDALMYPDDPDYMDPEYWWVGSNRYHKSHMIVLTGDMVPDILKPTYRYGGVSMTQKVYERVYAAERSGNEAPKMLLTKRTKVRKVDLAKYQANKDQLIRNLSVQNEMQNNHATAVIGHDEELSHIDTSLSDLDQVIKGQYGLVCAVFGDPESKLLGSGHSGLGTGETDEDYYIAELEEMQGNEMTDLAMAHYARLMPSMGIKSEPEIIWEPMKVQSEKEAADTRHVKAQTDKIYWDMGAVDDYDIRQKITSDKDSGYDMLEDRELVDDDPDEET